MIYGFTTALIDPLGNVTLFERNEVGRVTMETGPDPDGEGPESPPVTSYFYDAAGNLTWLGLPDGGAHSWTYDETLNVPTSYTDERGVYIGYRRVAGYFTDRQPCGGIRRGGLAGR